jgi:hypothetical protein
MKIDFRALDLIEKSNFDIIENMTQQEAVV